MWFKLAHLSVSEQKEREKWIQQPNSLVQCSLGMLRSRNSNHFPWKSTGWMQPYTKPPGISASCQSERWAKNASVRFWHLNLGLLFFQNKEKEINKAQTTRTQMQTRYFSRVGSQMHVPACTWEVSPHPPLLFTLLSKQAYLHSVRGSIRWCLWLINPAPALHGNIFTQKDMHLPLHAKTWHWTPYPTQPPPSLDCQIKTMMNGPCLYCLHTESESVSISGM